MTKKFYNLLIYFSFIFLCVALYKADYLKIPEIHSLSALMYSFPFLFAGFIGNAYAWKKFLNQSEYNISLTESIASIGLTIFGKYIPGKIWMIVGRSTYISVKSKSNLTNITLLSFIAQFIALWVGLSIGFIGVCILGGFKLWGWLMIALWVGLTIMIFSQFFYEILNKAYYFIFRKKIKFECPSFNQILSLLPSYFTFWILWSIGFYFLILSLTDNHVPISIGLGFPLAGTIGIIAIFSPGGLGIREGIIIGYITLSGLSLNEATTIAVTARVWFLIGEIFFFLAGWLAHLISKKRLPLKGME